MPGMDRGTSGAGSVLLPTGRKMQSYAFMRSLGRRGIDTVVASEHDRIPHTGSRFCSERVRLSSSPADLPAYRDELLGLAARPDVDTIVPVREYEAYVLAKYRDAFEEQVSLVGPDAGTLATAHDRYRLAEAAERAGVPVARTRLLSEVEDWDSDVVVKSRYNLLTGDYVDSYPDDRVEEARTVRFLPAGTEPDRSALRDRLKHDPIVQDFVPQANKYLYCALWEEGDPVATYQHRQIRQNSWVGGGGVYRKSAQSHEVERAANDLLSHLDWTGFACIEYLKDAATGEWKFLEINPRTWQSLPEAVRAGVDFPYIYWLRARGNSDPVDDDYETGTACHIAYGEAGHLLSVLRDESPFAEPPSFARTAWDIATSCLRHPRFDYLRADDPGLFLSSVRETLSAGITSSRDYDAGEEHLRSPPTGDPNSQ